MNDTLWTTPGTWKWCSLGDAASWSSGGTPKSTEPLYYNGGIPWLIIGDLNDDVVKHSAKSISKAGFENSSVQFVEPGSVMIAMYGSIGKLGIAGIKCTTNQAIAFTRGKSEAVEQKYLFYYLRAVRMQLLNAGKGGTQANISQTVLKEFPICIAPVNEQKRIVKKLETVLGRIKTCQRRLERIPTLIKRFRQSILAAACSGRLTADWRNEKLVAFSAAEEHKIALIRVSTEYEFACQSAKRNSHRKPSRPTCLENYGFAWEDTRDVPHDWIRIPLGKVCRKITDGTHDSPKATITGVPYITAKNIRERKIDFDNCSFLPVEIHNEIYARCNPANGDVVIVNIGAGTATPALVRTTQEFSMKNVALLKPIQDLLLGEYVEFYQLLMKPKIFDEVTRGGAQPFMGLDLIKTIPFLLPPLAEQQEIVRRVESLFTLADQLEARYKKGKAYVDKLTQSILAKAFRGELVPQDPNDEPAEKLLERIQAGGKANKPSQ